jgi:single-stranded-DNA-specific exonuclease
MAARWLVKDTDPQAVDALAASLSIRRPAAAVLWGRGMRDAVSARVFLDPSLEDLHDPAALAGMDLALDRLRRAIRGGEKILIYGDYDVDGTTSVVILKRAIELAGGTPEFHVPNRLKDGYGMRAEVVEEAAAKGVSLIISVDTGIRAAAVVRRAAELGIDVIITDHHLPEAELPPALAVLNPNRPDCAYPEKNLCGVGVAFKLVQGLLGGLDWPPAKLRRVLESFLKLVAIGTVADVVPLTGENRIIVKHGLAGLRDVRNPGLRALLDVAGFTGASIPTAGQIAFRIAPRMNAAGRMATANDVIELFLTEDPDRARTLAEQLDALNAERQKAEAEILAAILDECSLKPVEDQHAALVFAGEGWHRGVLGIVASRIVERFHRPVFVLSQSAEEGLAQGSGRSIHGFHLLEALEAMPELFLKFGGHMYAAGLTMGSGSLEEFRGRFQQFAAARLTPADFVARLEIDASISLDEISEQSVSEIAALGPFGCGNPLPVFAALDVEVAGPAVVWKEKHLRVPLRQGRRTVWMKAWNFAARADEFQPGAHIDAAFTLEEDEYSAAKGYPNWAATLRDVRPAGYSNSLRADSNRSKSASSL